MTSSLQPNAEHQEIWDLLPWLVNGRLGDSDRRRAEAHLRVCGDCRAECEAQRQIHAAMSADTGIEWAPAAGLNKLRQRIMNGDLDRVRIAHGVDALDAHDTQSARRDATTTAQPARVQTRRRRYLLAAASVAMVAVTLMTLGYRYLPGRIEEGSYATVTTAAPPTGAVIRAVFSPAATLSELESLLDDAHLRIVSGPTEAGVYSLAMTGSQSVDWSLKRLRGHETVRFAEPIGAGPVPPVP